jgi:phenylalanyl-tRNA synthetase beta chain
MDISYNWLRDLIDVTAEPRELAERLTMAGIAVDAVKENGDDYILEFDLTSNRPDCLSHFGIAREVAALYGGAARVPETKAAAQAGSAEEFTAVEIKDPDLCPRYAGRVVRGVKIGPSPEWLANRLQAIGQRPINNVADATNYVMHELGQPLHAFDLETLIERRIVVRRAHAGERLRTLDGVERELDAEMLVIADAARPVAIAGVMGGEETEISAGTTDVLIESAYFDPYSVRRTSKVLGLSTEASYRFERGIDYEGVRRAQDRCVALICEIAGGTATEDALDVYPVVIEPRVVSLRPRRVEEITGLSVPAGACERVLLSLGFTREHDDSAAAADGAEGEGQNAASALPFGVAPESLIFRAPTWRRDVSIEEDLVEEVARVIGYDKIGEALPPAGAAGEYLPGEVRRRSARRALTGLGFDEAVNISFIAATNVGRYELIPELAAEVGQDGEQNEAAFVVLKNPIIEGATLMRPTLLAGLLDSVRHNFNHGTRDVRLFEMGHIFAAGPAERPLEPEAFALVMTGAALEANRATASEAGFFDFKGAFESAVDAMNVPGLGFEPASVRHLREGQSARVLLGAKPIGWLGRLAEDIAALYKFRQPVFVAEVSLTALLEAEAQPVRYTPLPRYPAIVRDISLVADRGASFESLRSSILGLGLAECRAVSLVDVYEGANLPPGKRSVTLRVEYRSDERTLRDEEVDELHARVLAALEVAAGATLRT